MLIDALGAAILEAAGRTEDIVMSPSGRRLAVAAFYADAILLADVDVERDPLTARPSAVRVDNVTRLTHSELARPHGLAFLDESTLLVANRSSQLLLLGVDGSARVLVDGSSAVPVRSPGSVAVRTDASGLADVVVCNNYAHDVTRYAIDVAGQCDVLDSEVLLRHRLDLPDGIAVSPSGRWLAVSNHNTSQVFVYRYDAALGPDSEPSAVLTGGNYPHGLRFSADDRRLVVADAGLPYVYVYGSDSGDWTGEVAPRETIRVMADEEFLAGKHNPQEGGPKGIAFVDDRLFVVTSEQQQLACFELEAASPEPEGPVEQLARLIATRALARAAGLDARVLELERQIAALDVELATVARERDVLDVERDHLSRAAETCEREVGELQAALDDAEHRAENSERGYRDAERHAANLADALEEMRASTSWRISAPLRLAGRLVSPFRGRARAGR